jgi:hypothetical protein
MTKSPETAARLVAEYAAWMRAECMDQGEFTSDGLMQAIIQSQGGMETAALGVALLECNESLADAAYRFGGASYDPRLEAIADALGWTAE